MFNIGVGLGDCFSLAGNQRLRMQDVNLRQVFEAFCELYAPARELMATGTPLGELKGAPLRCSRDGALYSRAGLLAVSGRFLGNDYLAMLAEQGPFPDLRQIVVLASDVLSGHVTGQVVTVAGGMEGRTVHDDA